MQAPITRLSLSCQEILIHAGKGCEVLVAEALVRDKRYVRILDLQNCNTGHLVFGHHLDKLVLA